MSAKPLPEITISKAQARHFVLAHQRLLPPRKLRGKQGVLDFVRHVNCIQNDPINVVGQNHHLVLQSRVKDYKPQMLDELRYQDRNLVDGFDKQMAIYPAEDWPDFAYYRTHFGENYSREASMKEAAKLTNWVKKEITARGPLSSIDLEENTKVDWWLSGQTRAVRIALDMLFVSGELVIHHRVGTRRYFDLSKRALPPAIYKARKPRQSHEAYLDWHMLRRCEGVGLVHSKKDAKWGGLLNWGGAVVARLSRLADQGELVRVAIEDLPRKQFYVRPEYLPALKAAAKASKAPLGQAPLGAAFIGPLDNLMWDGFLIPMLFDFHYTWEVYKPANIRKWGYYVLPVLAGERFVARIDPAFDRVSKTFIIQNWWWEKGVNKNDDELLAALRDCVQQFCKYLGANSAKLGEKVKRDIALKQVLRDI
jgi:uncharacterized protein YcaQ